MARDETLGAAMNRWAVCVDIEGTTRLFAAAEFRFFEGFDAVLAALWRIGERVYPENPHRLFAHQLGGDGVVVVSEFCEGFPEVPISIAIILLQVLLSKGLVGKGGVSKGEFADVQGCFPSLRSLPHDSEGTYRIGRGILRTFPVMGTALINSHRFASGDPRGCRLAIDRATLDGSLPEGIVVTKETSEAVVVDWVHSSTPLTRRIADQSGVLLPSANDLELSLQRYVATTASTVDEEWKENSLSLNGCGPASPRRMQCVPA